MKIIRKIVMFFATFIIVAHTFMPHQHKAQLEIVLHKCFFSEEDSTSSNIFGGLEDIVKHVNLGEKQLGDFRISTYEYDFAPITIFEVPDILSILNYRLRYPKKVTHTYYYTTNYLSKENQLSNSLRGPPVI